MRAVGTCSSTRPSHSSVEGSAQWRSSHTASTGCRSASSNSHATRASCVFCRCCWGVRCKRRIALRQRHAEQRRQERHRLLQGQARRAQRLLQLVEPVPQGHRPVPAAATAADGRSPGTARYFGDRANSETQSVLHPRYTHARAAPPPGAICQCPPRRSTAPPGPCLPALRPALQEQRHFCVASYKRR